ncbi:glutamate-rich protein 2 [Polypterus senegalus]|uniref:glutamate-rich protein 2 n=1 Tax=Polypterus senegalus TaxID=55291 RepID=UPI0019647A61|nr:glutamate-rich protein 2 [Polypterus senegalus]
MNMNRSHGLVKSPRHPSKISGQLEVLSPEDGIIVGQLGIKARRTSSDGPLLSLKGSVNGSLQVLDDRDGVLVEQLHTVSRARSSASRKNSEGRMTHTPTKQISLNAPKVPSDICLRDAEKPLNMKQSVQTRNKAILPPHVPGDAASDLHGSQSETEQKMSICKVMKGQPMESEINDEKPEDSVGSIEPVVLSPSVNMSSPVNVTNISTKSPGSDEGETDSTADSEEEEEADSEDEDRKAPIELLGEFLHAVMNENYTLANKLCQMILIYEADNPEAKQFIPLIEAKLLIEQEQDEHESTDESSSEDSDDDSSTESDSSVSGDSSDEDSDTSEGEADDDTQEA